MRKIILVLVVLTLAGSALAQVDPGRTKGTIRPTSQPVEQVPQHSACSVTAPGL